MVGVMNTHGMAYSTDCPLATQTIHQDGSLWLSPKKVLLAVVEPPTPYLPTFRIYLPACLLACLPACLPTCLLACLPACLPTCLPACLPAYLLAYLLT